MTIPNYITTITKLHKSGLATEHSYRGALQQLIESMVSGVSVTNEPARVACGAPDYIITRRSIPIGYIEAKDIGKNLDAKEYKDQFTRYKSSLPNLVITDYIEFRLYREGEYISSVKIAELVDGKLHDLPQNFSTFSDFINEFCTHVTQTIRSSSKLAKMMAGKARMLASVIENALNADEKREVNTVEDNANITLRDQLEAFRQVLIHDIDPKAFADIYAQTIAYGMFAARLHDPSLDNFSRQEAAELIPKTNPFLRKLFQYIAGYDLDDRIKWIVDALADIFRATDVQLIENDEGHPNEFTNCHIIGLYSNGSYMLSNSRALYATGVSKPIEIFAADIDGNGQDEIITVADYGYLTRVRATSLSVNISNFSVNYTDIMDYNGISPISGAEAQQFNFLDIDGDGKSELIAQRDDPNEVNSFQIYKPFFNGTAWEMSTIYDAGFPSRWHDVYFGDFNGDGKIDLLTWEDQNGWSMDLFNGVNFSNSGYNLSYLTIDPTQSHISIFIRDFNNDGKNDIGYISNTAFSKKVFTFLLRDGIYSMNELDFSGNINILNSYDIVVTLAETKSSQYQICDFNGDGNEDIGLYYKALYPTNTYGGEFSRIIINEGKNNRTLISTANGLNVRTKYNYANLADNTTYTKGSTNINGCMDLQHPSIFVVKSVETDDGTTSADYNTVSYSYKGAVIHREGKGFLGFTGTIRQSSISPVAVLSVNEINTSHFFMQPVLNQTYKMESGNKVILSNTTFINALFNDYVSPKIYLPYTSFSVSKDYISNTKTEFITNYVSNIGNIASQYQSVFSDTNSITAYKTISTDYQNYVSNGSWCLAKPKDVDVTEQIQGETPITRSKHIQYDANGNIYLSVDFPNMPKAVTTTYSINDFGLPEAATVYSIGLAVRTSTFEYDDYFRFVTKTIDPELYSSTSTYDGAFGNIISETDPNDLTTRYQYGAFGELVKAISPEGNWVNTELNWSQPPGNHYCFYSEITSNTAPTSMLSYDRLGREIYASQPDKEGNIVVVTLGYDNKGQLIVESVPHFIVAGVPSRTDATSYIYDEYGRVSSIETPNDVVITTTHPTVSNPGRTTITTNLYTGVSTSQTKDAAGNILSATDPGGTISYNYYSDGNIKSITAPDGSITGFTYDEYGRQETLSDPDAGTNTYVYNAYGELEEQTDAKGNHFEMTYDKNGRLVEKECLTDGTITTYNYNDISAQQGSRGALSFVSFTDDNLKNSSYSYTYDEYSRVQQKTIMVNQPYVYNYTYTSKGELEEYSFPDGFTIKYQYDNNGFLTAVMNVANNKIIYAPGSTNESGQLLDYTIADGQLFGTMTYDEYGLPIAIKTGSTVGGSNIQHLETLFDQYTGNLLWRKDLNKNLTESFSYDNVHHSLLTEWAVNGQPAITMSYNNANGNIMTKSDVTCVGSEYQYDIPGKPHALASIEDPIELPTEDLQIIDYNCFNSVEKITHSSEQKILEIQYGPDEQRVKTEYYTGNTNLAETKYFIGSDFEIVEKHDVGVTLYHHYLPGGGLYVNNSTGSDNMYYILTDYQGNWNK
ncbi:MAG: VCBS repeat-containing protein, partial [Bacteroidales bacterium]|nr:VCBS repeat-containing protein [Bacteroidales bacterium]